jgi:hypothetical protein
MKKNRFDSKYKYKNMTTLDILNENFKEKNEKLIIENLKINLSEYKYQSWCLNVGKNGIISADDYSKVKINVVEDIISKYLNEEGLKGNLLAYLSIIFWGFTGSSSEGKVTPERAFSRIKKTGLLTNDSKMNNIKIITDNNLYSDYINHLIESVKTEVKNKQYDSAIAIATLLPQLGFSFASKLIMFIDPINCGVLDKVVSEKLTSISLEKTTTKTKNGIEQSYLKPSINNFLAYSEYCKWLQKIAPLIKDENNESLTRAVDVERFIFSLKT